MQLIRTVASFTRLRPALAIAMSLSMLGLFAPGAVARPARSFAVIAHIDTGINPYHEVFRDTSPLAYVHPSKYIPGYPEDIPALRLSLEEPDWEAAFKKDRAIWEGLLKQWEERKKGEPPKMYWVPGTKIIGAVRFDPGGTNCTVHDAPPLSYVDDPSANCPDWPIVDDHGHGTMTATRMAGNRGSLCPECRIVSIEGLGWDQVKWAADQGWIDVQTNSWGFIFPQPIIWAYDQFFGTDIAKSLERAAKKHLVYFASGNGAGFFLGFTPWPTQIAPTLVKNAIWAGAHDNGKIAGWSGSPAHVVADGYGGLAAHFRSTTGFGPSPITCCTSASSPYAASEGAAIVLQARKILGDTTTGVDKGVVARGDPPTRVRRGPLADGVFTLGELRDVVKHTAEPRPREGRHDGWIHWLGDPRAPDLLPHGPGANAFCQGCWTLPVAWSAIPPDVPAYVSIGYGGANERSLELATKVLLGVKEAPNRSEVDEFFEKEALVRDAVHHPDEIAP